MANWKCEACGEVHHSNPTTCKNCGHSILQQHEGDGGGWRDWIPFL